MEGETPIKLLAIQAANQKSGFYVAFIPSDLDDEQIAAALAEAGIEPEQAMEISGWQTSSSNVSVAFVPFPPSTLGTELLEPSQSRG